MTNEEAIEILYDIRAHYASLTAGYPPHDCYGLGNMKCSDICNALLKGIKLLKQEPKTGYWIPRNSFLLNYKCSKCGWESEKYNYCPNCGLKMVEPQEGE